MKNLELLRPKLVDRVFGALSLGFALTVNQIARMLCAHPESVRSCLDVLRDEGMTVRAGTLKPHKSRSSDLWKASADTNVRPQWGINGRNNTAA